MGQVDSFLLFRIESGLLHEHYDGNFRTLLFGFAPGGRLALPVEFTHMGVVVDGSVTLSHNGRERRLFAGDYFSVIGPATIEGDGAGVISSAFGYTGMNVFGGPIEDAGRLQYIDGCSDTLLVPPVRRGDACLNYLHFPPRTTQTPHTHPSVRTGVVYRGAGECAVPGRDPIPLLVGSAFVIPTDSVHSFNTVESTMDVIAFHPDSDAGMTDDDHPMINRTIVNGVSAKFIPEIRTIAAQTERASASDDTVRSIVAVVRRHIPAEYADQIDDPSADLSNLGVGSLEMADLICDLERSLSIRFPADMIEAGNFQNFTSITESVRVARSALDSQQAAASSSG